jgi:pimeloyl-ACP methyl ester carboxylesterase
VRVPRGGTAKLAAGAVAAAILGGCATPAQVVDRTAVKQGFTRTLVRGTGFDHIVYTNKAASLDQPLHVYIEGDGSPYVDARTIARDPTPRSPVMLTLMALDPAPSLYVGRPCYFGLQTAAECSPAYWTVARFSADVLDSMAAVINRAAGADSAGIVLLGHSGGGALAVLLAQRLANVNAVVTVAGNLDTAAWTALHGYSPLASSLNPSDRPLTGVPFVLHLAGAEDEVVPPSLIEMAARTIGGEIRVVAGTRHTCCWEAVWPSVLGRLP